MICIGICFSFDFVDAVVVLVLQVALILCNKQLGIMLAKYLDLDTLFTHYGKVLSSMVSLLMILSVYFRL